eukprot:scaffold177952_cov19-Tisochrysis_lutea.AAC.1
MIWTHKINERAQATPLSEVHAPNHGQHKQIMSQNAVQSLRQGSLLPYPKSKLTKLHLSTPIANLAKEYIVKPN